jgi:hypothetical protein
MSAYAIAITEENLRGVIHSEAGPSYDLETALSWLEDHEEGWFLRDPGSPLDCEFFMPEVFFEMYIFLSNDKESLIRRVVKF